MTAVALIVVLAASVLVTVATAPLASAAGPPYSGPQTAANGPAYFGPAPNPIPYCESPTYLDPFPDNVNSRGRLDVGDSTSVTTNNITMELTVTEEGDTGGQYPGFFPTATEGEDNDQPKGIEMASDDRATVTLSEPLFYSQWIFTDVDRDNEGFFVTPDWTEQGEVAIFTADPDFTFVGTNQNEAAFNDTDTEGQDSQDIEGRVQVDFLGAVQGIDLLRDTGSGQSGFAVGGGCEAAGASKLVTSGPTWNGTSYDVSYQLRVRNNLPSTGTLSAAVLAAQSAAEASIVTANPTGIPLSGVELTDQLADPAFSEITVQTPTNASGALVINPDYDGLADPNLLLPGSTIDAETNELVELTVSYTPDLARDEWSLCVDGVGHTYSNQSTVTATAANIQVSDVSDDGVNPAPGDDNGVGGVDDPTLVEFPCPPAALDIVKTVVPGPDGTCPRFESGVAGLGPALQVTDTDVVTYCITVFNPAASSVLNTIITDDQAPPGFDGSVGLLPSGQQATRSFDVAASLASPTTNTAFASGQGPDGPLPQVSDQALIAVNPLPNPQLAIVKTVVPGPNGTCPADFNAGTAGIGDALPVVDASTVTYCISAINTGPGDATNVVISDPQAPASFDGAINVLPSGEQVQRSYDVQVSPQTPTRNEATVSGDGPYGAVPSATDDALIQVSLRPDPVLEIVKTVVTGPNGTCPDFLSGAPGAGVPVAVTYGDTVTYCITVLNSGAGDATGVFVVDDQAPAGFDGTIGDLAAGSEQTLSFDQLISARTPETNTALTQGEGINGQVGPVSDDAVIASSPQPNPVLEIVKTVVPVGTPCPATFDDGIPGLGGVLTALYDDTVTYCITVRNSGPTTATDVLVTDQMAPASFDGVVGTLQPNQEVNLSYAVVVDASTQAVNTATVSGAGPNGVVPSSSDVAQIFPAPQPDPVLEIVKTVIAGPAGVCPSFDEGTVGEGSPFVTTVLDTVTYCLAVKNAGERPASDVTVADEQAPASFDGSIGDLAVGQEVSLQFDRQVTDDLPLRNTATVTGNGPNGELPPDSDDSLIATSNEPDPVINIVKTAIQGPNGQCPTFAGGIDGLGPALSLLIGDTVTYCLTARNNGLRAATAVAVNDPQAPANFNGSIGVLAVNAEATRQFDLQVTANTLEINTAIVTGSGPNGPLPVDLDNARIDVLPEPDPILEIVKTVLPGADAACPLFASGEAGLGTALPVTIGESVTYCLSVRNVGVRAATAVEVSDPQAPAGFDGSIGVLAVQAEQTVSFTIVVTEATPAVNTAVVEGFGPNGALPADFDRASIDVLPLPDPLLEIVKSVRVGPDAQCPDFANGDDGPGDALSVSYGSTITYCMTVLNSGDGDATGVVVTDVAAPSSFDGQIGALPSGQEATVSFDVVVDADTPTTNTASVAGQGPNGPTPPASDTAVVQPSPLPNPVLEIVKTAVLGADVDCSTVTSVPGDGEPLPVIIGESVTFCIVASNSGPTTAENVSITDVQAGDESPWQIGSLSSQQSVTRSYTVVVAEGTPVTNTASVNGSGPNGPVPSAEDRSIIDPQDPPAPEITLTNTVVLQSQPCSDAQEGVNEFVLGTPDEDVRWCFEVTNTGNTPLVNVLFDNTPLAIEGLDVLAVHGNGATTLLPGESISFDVTDVIPDAGLVSLASVSARAAEEDGTIIPDLAAVGAQNDAEVGQTSVRLIKLVVGGENTPCGDAVTETQINAGEIVTWCFVVRNTGSVDLRVTEVRDSVLNLVVPIPLEDQTLSPGEAVTVSASTAVTEDTTNDASVEGTPLQPGGEPFPNPPEVASADTAKVDTLSADLSLTKGVSNSGPVDPGASLTYTVVVSNAGPDPAQVVKVSDTLPAGLSYDELPTDGWTCALDDGGRSFECLKSGDLEVDASATLSYTVTVDSNAPRGSSLTNTSTASADTTDPDLSNNTDTATTFTPSLPPPPNTFEYPGPFTPPEPDEVKGLAITGTASRAATSLAILLVLAGTTFVVTSRRRTDTPAK